MNELERFLKSLQEIKSLKDSQGSSYACFGVYDGGNEVCAVLRDPICRICRLMCIEASDNWIDIALEIAQSKLKP